MSANDSKSAKVRARLNHPIIDTDGHTVELTPCFSITSRRSAAPA